MRILEIILITTILAGAATPANGVSFKLGAQITSVGNSLTGELPNEGKWKDQASVGGSIMADLYFTEDVSISFQPGYTPRNSRQQFEWYDEVIAYYDYNFNYLTLPLIVRVTGEPVGIRGFVTAGLDFGILLDATVQTDTGKEDITDGLNSTTIGALFGAGVLFPVGRHFLCLELRYEQGLDDIVARDGTETEPGLGSPSVKYRGLSLLAGFLFTFGGE